MSIQSFKHDRPTIGVLAGWTTLAGATPDHYRASVVNGIQTAAHSRQCHLLLSWGIRRIQNVNLVCPAWPEISPETDFVPVGPWNTDGLIVFTPLGNQNQSLYLQKLIAQGFPVLFIASGEQGAEIVINNQTGIHAAIEHLVEHGHQRIAFLGGQPTDKGDSKARLDAYYSCVAEYKLDSDPNLVAWGWHDFTEGFNAMQKLFQSGVKFSAVMASNDNSAIGAMQAIKEAGLRIPQDMAIIGFDDQPGALAQVPPLSSVHVPLNLIGEQALTLMVNHLEGLADLKSVQISPQLVKRQSCGCIPDMIKSAANGFPVGRISTAQLLGKPDLHEIQQNLAAKMLNALSPEIILAGENQMQLIRYNLIDAFYTSLKQHKAADFQTAFLESIHEMEISDVNHDYWQEMISILRREMMELPILWDEDGMLTLAEDMLHQARAIVAESTQRQDYRHQYQRNQEAQALNSLTAQLSSELSEGQMIDLLNSHLPEVGIGHGRIMLFEGQDDDPVARSVVLDAEANSHRFPSRQFPPPGLYPPGDLLNVILIPLVFQNETLGYGAFEASDLRSCAVITKQLAATMKVSRLHAQVIELSLTDALTGLHNRRYFDLFLKNEMARSHRFSYDLSVIMADIDHFKEYNDLFGHPAGDEALYQIAHCLTQNRRETDFVARLGGEEFAFILPQTDMTGAVKVAEGMRTAISKLAGLKHQITISLGVATLCGQILEPEALVGLADQALYEAKRQGRNCVCVNSDD